MVTDINLAVFWLAVWSLTVWISMVFISLGEKIHFLKGSRRQLGSVPERQPSKSHLNSPLQFGVQPGTLAGVLGLEL